MSCKSLLCLARRCVAVGQLTLPAAIKTRGSALSGRFIQQRAWTSATRTVCLQTLRPLQSAVGGGQHRFFCTKEGASCEDEYPPLPPYEPESDTKDVHIVQVKGFSWSCKAEDLLQFFSDCRIHGGLSGIHMELDRQGRASGRAFIEMEHEEDVRKALEKHRCYLGPRYVEVYEVTNSDAEAVLKESAQPSGDDGVVMLRGLPFSCTEDDIAHFFSGLDIAENGITIVTDGRGRRSGKGFVQFSSQEEADKALLRDRELIGSRYIEVFPSRSEDIHSTWGRRASSDPSQSNPVSTTHATHRNVPLQGSSLKHYVHMRGLPYQVSVEEIVTFFSPLVVSKIVITCSPKGKLNGEADVFFQSHRDALAAMSRDRMNIGQRYIELFLNSVQDSDER